MKRIFLSILLCLCAATMLGNNPFRRYDVRSGLSENSVRSIVQDSIGYMWFATKDGLNRFDGRNFKVFGSSSDGNDRGYINCVTICRHKDNRQIWVAGTDELLLFDTQSEKFKVFDRQTEEGKHVHSVFSLSYDDRGVLWIGTGSGLFSWNSERNTLRRYMHTANPNSLPCNHVWVVCKDSYGTMWFGTRQGLARYNPRTDDFTLYISAGRDNEIMSITDGTTGNLWLGTWSGGLADFNKETGAFHYYFSEGTPHAISRIRTLFSVTADRYFIGSDDGLYLFESQSGRCEAVDNDLATESVYTCFRDREGGIWIGTYFSGVSYISPKHNDIELYYDDNAGGSLSGNAVSQFCEDAKGNLWIATENGGLNYFDTKSRRFRQYPSYNNLHALLLDGEELWIGTFSRGVDIMNTRTGAVRSLRSRPSDRRTLTNDHVYSFCKDRKGRIWIGTMAGCCIYDPHTRQIEPVPTLANSFIYDICEDSFGNIWLADKGGGMWRCDHADASLRNYRHDASDPNSLGSNWIISITIDKSGQLWCSTEGSGICRYDYQQDRFVNYTMKDNLPNGVIYGILDDGMGDLWLTSNTGIIRYDYKRRQSQVFTFEDGFQSNQFNFRSAYCARNGKFYVGGINGFNAFYPSQITVNQVKPTVALSYIGFPSQHGVQAVIVSDRLTVPYSKSTFDVMFDVLSYVVPGKNRFSYRLENLNDEWVNTDQNKVSFFGLPSGRYVLHVRACNNDGYWSENEAVLEIVVLPPWWRSTVAGIAYFLIGAFLLWVAYRVYMRRMRLAKEREMQQIELRKEQELFNSKMMFYTQIAHEIKTPVSLIKAPLDAITELNDCSPETEGNLAVIRKNTNRLMELIKQLLDFRKVDADAYQLLFNPMDVNMMLEDLVDGFKAAATEKGVAITIRLPAPHLIYNIDKEAIHKIVSNLLSNALKYAVAQIEITLEERSDAPHRSLVLRVWNDGAPIPHTEMENVFKPFYQLAAGNGQGIGIGLSLVKMLCDKHGGTVGFNAARTDGCEVVVEIPYVEPSPSSGEERRQPVVGVTEDEMTGWSLLIVDDNPDMTDFLAKNLGNNYNIFTAADGRAALDFLQQTPVDLIISDIVMPRMDGFDLLKAVRADYMLCHIPFVLLSARNSVDAKIAGLEYGADAYIEKPFSLNHMRATVNNLLENRRMLFNHFATNPDENLERVGGHISSEWLEKLDRIIDENLMNEEFTIDVLAEQMAISRSNLQRKLKGQTGMTPNDYIRLIRLKTAGKLLREGRYRVNEVCYIVGFNNASYFARCFQKQFGILPKEYARQKE